MGHCLRLCKWLWITGIWNYHVANFPTRVNRCEYNWIRRPRNTYTADEPLLTMITERNWREMVPTKNTSLIRVLPSKWPSPMRHWTAYCCLYVNCRQEAASVSHHCWQRMENKPVFTTTTNLSTLNGGKRYQTKSSNKSKKFALSSEFEWRWEILSGGLWRSK